MSRRSRPLLVALLALTTLALASPSASARPGDDDAPFTLVSDGRPIASVVHAGDDRVVLEAARDLVAYVERISGARLQATQGAADAPGPTLHIGETEHYERIGAALDRVELDGFVLARVGEDLIVAGRVPQGTSNGVTTLLQDHFGVRWYYRGPLWETAPETDSLTVEVRANGPDGAHVENPAFLERALWGGMPNLTFGRHHRLTLPGVALPFVKAGHHLSRVVNPAKHGDSPDYFALQGGRRRVENGAHPCFTHPDMPDVFFDYVLAHDGSLGVNDNLSACRCESCLALDGDSAPYQGMVNVSESYSRLIAEVARRVAAVRPERRIGIFAYQLTNAPPTSVDHLGENVDVVLCQDTSQYFDREYAELDREMSAAWVEKCGHVRFYDYIGINYWVPRYFPGLLGEQLAHLAASGVAGYGTHASSMVDSAMPMYYVLYRMLWDASLDPRALVDEMLRDLYREAAPPIAEFYAHWEACWMRQTRGKWFYGMDDFRGEMAIYSPADFERGRELLARGAELARDETVRRRIDWLQSRYAFTYESARAFHVSMDAIRRAPSDDPEDAVRLSNDVADAWRAWSRRLERTVHLEGTTMESWIGKTARVRIWSLKQQMRDASIAPLVRWVTAHEGRVPPARLRFTERTLAGVGLLNRRRVESLVTDRIDAAPYPARVDALLVSDAPRATSAPRITAASAEWDAAGELDAAPWTYLDLTVRHEIGKYEDPVARHHQVLSRPPSRDDLSVTCRALWDDEHLYLRVVARDERHVADPDSGRRDRLRVALAPARDDFLYDVHSWTYIWGGYRGSELELELTLVDESEGDSDLRLVRRPDSLSGSPEPATLVRAAARRHHPRTVYEVAVPWRLLPDFEPTAESSIGLWVAVEDSDGDDHVLAEYGSVLHRVGRPSEFSAVRLRGAPAATPRDATGGH